MTRCNEGGATKTFAALVIVAFLLPFQVSGAEAEPQTRPDWEWWGPTEPGDGFHIRVPVTVSNPQDPEDPGSHILSQPFAKVELDLAEILAETGWVTNARGTKEVLQSWELDLDSVRVISMFDLEDQEPGTSHGRMRAHDPTREGEERFVVPSFVFPSHLESSTSGRFDAKTNPILTVMWRVDEDLGPGDERHYLVYLDSLTNRDHEPRLTHGIEDAALAGLHGPAPSKELFGYFQESPKNIVSILGLHDDTEVQLYVRSNGGDFRLRESNEFAPNPVEVDQGERANMVVGTNVESEFKLIADKPVIAYGRSTGYAPGIHGGFADTEFQFEAPSERLYFMAAGHEEPTVVQVDPGGRTYHLNDATNPLPYTPSPYAQGSGSDCSADNPDFPAVNPGTVYTARVVSGKQVLLQLGPLQTMAQIPSELGAPTGQTFHSVLAHGGEDGCGSRRGSWFATAATEGGTVAVESKETADTIDSRPLDATPIISGPFSKTGGVQERPLQFESVLDDAWLFSGRVQSGAVPPLAGPLLGKNGGTEFMGFGETIVFSPYGDTTLKVDLEYSGTGQTTTTETLGKGEASRFLDRAVDDPLNSIHIESNKPVIVYPRTSTPNHLAGLPIFAPATVPDGMNAQYRGYLLDFHAAGNDRSNPVTKSTVPGKTVTYRLELENLGRTAEGDLLEDIAQINIDAPEEWEVEINAKTIQLSDSQPREVLVDITPPEDAETGDFGQTTVEVRSSGNPDVATTLDLVTFIQSSFDVGIWFDFEDSGPKFQQQIKGPGQDFTYTIKVKNLGTVADRFDLDVSPGPRGWSATIHDQTGIEIDEVQLASTAPDNVANVTLRLEPPSGIKEDVVITTVTARSQSEPAVFDRVTATTKMRAPSDIQLQTPVLSDLELPGEEAVFPFTLVNTGEGAADLEFETQRVAGPSWSEPSLAIFSSADSSRQPIEGRYALPPGEEQEILLILQIPTDARAGDLADIRLKITEAGGDAFEAFFTAVTANLHDLQIHPINSPLAVEQLPSTVTVPLTVKNLGNLDEVLESQLRSSPTGQWNVSIASNPYVIEQETESTTTLHVNVPAGTAPGEHTVVVDLVARDGTKMPFQVPLRVDAIAAMTATSPSDAIIVQPNGSVTTDILVKNTGNVPARVEPKLDLQDEWQPEWPRRGIMLQPLAESVMPVTWHIPSDARLGESQRHLSFTVAPIGSGSTSELDLDLTFDVGQSDLSIDSLTKRDVPGGLLVGVIVTNSGERSAKDVTVSLETGNATVDSLKIGEIPVGKSSPASLLLPSDSEFTGPFYIIVDPDNVVAESNEANNQAQLDQATQEAPTISSVGMIILLGLVMVIQRSRRNG